MDLFEKLLLFIRASSEQNMEPQLYSLHRLCPYFFAFDMTNCGRITPAYLSQMCEVNEKDNKT